MYKITNINSLGTDYSVGDNEGRIIGYVRVIPHTDILNAAMGPYDPERHPSIQEYIDKSKKFLAGFEDIDPLRVLWYATEENEVSLSELIEFAVNNEYDNIILEHLENTE